MMRRIYEYEWTLIVETIYFLNETASRDELKETALRGACQLTACDKAVLFTLDNEIDGANPVLRASGVGIEPSVAEALASKSYPGDPFAMSPAIARELRVMLDTDYIPEECRGTSEFYHDAFKATGTYYGLRAFLVKDRIPLGCIMLMKDQKQGNFTEKDQRILELLAPHIAQKLASLTGAETKAFAAAEPRINLEVAQRWHLSEREITVAEMASMGLSDREIAEKLCISVSTLKKHLSNIYRKLNVNSRIKMLNILKAK